MSAFRPFHRRHFLACSASSLLLGSAAALAQPANKIWRIAVLTRPKQDTGSAPWRAWRDELHRLGYVEGQSIDLAAWSTEDEPVSLAELVGRIIASKPDIIFAPGHNLVVALKMAGGDVPVVGIMGNPLGTGLVRSLAQPGGNITGLSIDAGPELMRKRLGLLREVVPGAYRVASLIPVALLQTGIELDIRNAAGAMGMVLVPGGLSSPADEDAVRSAFAGMLHERADCFWAGPHLEVLIHRDLIARLALEARLPGIFVFRENVEAGGLMAYAVDVEDIFRKAAHYIDRILRGANPGMLPIQQPSKFDLVINQRTADALGLTIPDALLASADTVLT